MAVPAAASAKPHVVPPTRPRWVLPLVFAGAFAVGLFGGLRAIGAMTDGPAGAGVLSEQADASTPSTIGVSSDEPADRLLAATDGGHEGMWVDPTSSGRPWSALGAVEGVLTFRGNPTRSYHGRGPVPSDPVIDWSYEIGCSLSSVAGEAREWCGTGWTGQPLVFPAPDGNRWWLAVGGYNRAVNFLDPDTGRPVLAPFVTGDIIKGTATVDPDGYPLVYSGSRDNYLHVVAIDGDEPVELWSLSSTEGGRTLWNNDWDGSPMVVNDHLIVGGENSRFYVVKLNRGFDDDGRVTVDPEVLASVEGWDDELLRDLGDSQVSIENSVAISGSVAYFANSGGLVQGWDLAPLADGEPPERVFRFWTGDDTDASVVIDDEGDLYVASEYERGTARSRELGQVFRLDPSNPDDPLVWSVEANAGIDTGVWATPALHRDLALIATDDSRLLAIDREEGEVRWTLTLGGPLWSSPVVVDDVLLQADCTTGLHAFDVSDTERTPPRMWTLPIEGCIESTPVVWDGRIYVGSRSGYLHAIADRAR